MQSRKQRLGARTSLLLFIVLLIIVQNRLMDINWGIMSAIFCHQVIINFFFPLLIIIQFLCLLEARIYIEIQSISPITQWKSNDNQWYSFLSCKEDLNSWVLYILDAYRDHLQVSGVFHWPWLVSKMLSEHLQVLFHSLMSSVPMMALFPHGNVFSSSCHWTSIKTPSESGSKTNFVFKGTCLL